jgi:hypothetical protein
VGRIEGQGYAALGESIAKGITGAASAVAGYAKEQKQLESQNKAYENLFKNPLVQNMFFQDKQGPEGVITAKDQASQFLAQTADMKPSEKNMFFNTIVPPAIGQYYKMQQLQAEAGAAKDRIITGAFANRAAELASTPTPPAPAMVVPAETGAGIISTTPAVVPVQPSPMQPSAKPISPWLQYKPKQKLGGS